MTIVTVLFVPCAWPCVRHFGLGPFACTLSNIVLDWGVWEFNPLPCYPADRTKQGCRSKPKHCAQHSVIKALPGSFTIWRLLKGCWPLACFQGYHISLYAHTYQHTTTHSGTPWLHGWESFELFFPIWDSICLALYTEPELAMSSVWFVLSESLCSWRSVTCEVVMAEAVVLAELGFRLIFNGYVADCGLRAKDSHPMPMMIQTFINTAFAQ